MKKKQKRSLDRAYLKAVEEIEKDRVNEVKVIVKQVLEGIVAAQRERKVIDEKLTLLKHDLEDIRQGRVEKIKARHAEVRDGKKWVPFDEKKLEAAFLPAWDIRGVGGQPYTNLTLGHVATTGNFSLSDGSLVTVSNSMGAAHHA